MVQKNCLEKPKIVVVVGPTAVGKTALSIDLAKQFNGEIVGADSVQIYKGLNIGSAKVTHSEKKGVRHHMISIISPKENYSVGDYVAMAKKEINKILKRGKLPIVVGGTGLYVSSLLYEIGAKCGRDEEYRAHLEQIAESEGTSKLYEMLKEVDEESALLIHPNHKTRIIRALEIYHITGQKKSDNKNSTTSPYNYLLIGLNEDREVLYERINQRVDKMLASGLIKEVKGLMKKGLTLDNQSMKAIGYKETYAFLTNQLSEEEFIDKLKQNSRNYAKRQLTWFKKMPNISWHNYKDKQIIINIVGDFING